MSQILFTVLENATACTSSPSLDKRWQAALDAAETATLPEPNDDVDEIDVNTYMRNWKVAEVRLCCPRDHVDCADDLSLV